MEGSRSPQRWILARVRVRGRKHHTGASGHSSSQARRQVFSAGPTPSCWTRLKLKAAFGRGYSFVSTAPRERDAVLLVLLKLWNPARFCATTSAMSASPSPQSPAADSIAVASAPPPQTTASRSAATNPSDAAPASTRGQGRNRPRASLACINCRQRKIRVCRSQPSSLSSLTPSPV